MPARRSSRISVVGRKKGFGCSSLLGCLFITGASTFVAVVLMAMVPSVRDFARDRLRALTGRSIERVTIPEGWNRYQIADRLAERGVVDTPERFLAATEDADLLSRYAIGGATAEGYLFPDTYEFYLGEDAATVVEVMVETFVERFQQLSTSRPGGLLVLSDIGEDPRHVAVVLASIVEKEAAIKREKPLIAGVFINRLTLERFSSRLLQADPTISYGCIAVEPTPPSCEEFDGRLRRRHLQDAANTYNTYMHAGLPPGPISNPGLDSLEAVLDPAETEYLYFVSRRDGTHEFSRTLRQHRQAVERYRR
jgi:UPF0755 protein